MSYSEILKTSDDGRYRVRLIADEDAPEPYDDGQSPLLRLDYHDYNGWRAEHVIATGRPLDDDARIQEAAERWGYGRNSALFEKYLRAYYGTREIVSWHSGSYQYVTYDTAKWRTYIGVTEEVMAAHPDRHYVNMNEYRSWCEGDCWGYVVEKRVTWHTDDPDYADEARWEGTDDSCWEYYGRDYAEEEARQALACATGNYVWWTGEGWVTVRNDIKSDCPFPTRDGAEKALADMIRDDTAPAAEPVTYSAGDSPSIREDEIPALIITAAELWEYLDRKDPDDRLSATQIDLLNQAAAIYQKTDPTDVPDEQGK